jgi:hypothetical protein
LPGERVCTGVHKLRLVREEHLHPHLLVTLQRGLGLLKQRRTTGRIVGDLEPRAKLLERVSDATGS